MRKRLLFGLVVLGCLAMLGFFAVRFIVFPGHRINEETIKQIQHGMTRQEIIELLGGEPGDYRLNKRSGFGSGFVMPSRPPLLQEARSNSWLADGIWLEVAFDDKDRMIGKFIIPFSTSPPGLLEFFEDHIFYRSY